MKLTVATESEKTSLIRSMMMSHPAVMKEVLSTFHPLRLPKTPKPDDLLLKRCFACKSEDGLSKFHDVKVCNSCNNDLNSHDGTITRDRVQNFFHFSKSEADNIPRTTKFGGFYGGIIYCYKVSTVVKKCQAKYGSLYNMISLYR
jgi:hypothetical protein